MVESLTKYAQEGRPTGGFLRAVLANDLIEAATKADDENALLLLEYARFLYNHMPSDCWGSYEIVAAHLEKFR